MRSVILALSIVALLSGCAANSSISPKGAGSYDAVSADVDRGGGSRWVTAALIVAVAYVAVVGAGLKSSADSLD